MGAPGALIGLSAAKDARDRDGASLSPDSLGRMFGAPSVLAVGSPVYKTLSSGCWESAAH